MNSTAKQDFITNFKDIQQALQQNQNIVFRVYALNSEIEKQIADVFGALTKNIGRTELKPAMFTIIRELVVNGIKANCKRIHFAQLKLDINDNKQYRNGISSFKEQLTAKAEEFRAQCKKDDLFVQVAISHKNENIVFAVSNNSAISDTEKNRFKQKLVDASKLNDMTEALETMMDYSEGAGLGLPMIFFMLRNLGSRMETFNIYSNDKQTSVQFTIPKQTESIDISTKLTKKILGEVEQLPPFPENISHIQRLINDEKASISRISSVVKQDPSLTADLLRMANSAGYANYKKVETIDEALINIGLKGLNNLLVATATHSIIEKRYRAAMTKIWDHSLRAAFYCDRLCNHLNKKHLKNISYLAGLLHDLGKIVLLSLQPKTMRMLDQDLDASINSASSLEEISFGINHAEIGGIIADHWQFDAGLIEAIKRHHFPIISKDEHRDIVYLTYIANLLLDIERDYGNYNHVEIEVLEFLNLELEQLQNIHTKMQKEYEKTLANV